MQLYPTVLYILFITNVYSFLHHSSNIKNFSLFSEKRHKEARLGKKFTNVGRSSIARHYRLAGRGGGIPRYNKITGLPTKEIKLPARRCAILGKMDNRSANKISHSGHKTRIIKRVNLAWRKIWFPQEKCFIKLRMSARGLKTMMTLGFEECVRRFNVDLTKARFAGFPKHSGRYKVPEFFRRGIGSRPPPAPDIFPGITRLPKPKPQPEKQKDKKKGLILDDTDKSSKKVSPKRVNTMKRLSKAQGVRKRAKTLPEDQSASKDKEEGSGNLGSHFGEQPTSKDCGLRQ